CRCPACTFRGAGRLLAAAEAAAGVSLGGSSPEGAVRLEAAACRGVSPDRPFVTLDGAPQDKLDPRRLGELVTRLRAGHAPMGRA
ncbi:MAG: NAD(P)H-dependent oxidoreductase subunit E, partial [Candidatus Limnocylindrales bacterium]